jgi:hypothetical protein
MVSDAAVHWGEPADRVELLLARTVALGLLSTECIDQALLCSLRDIPTEARTAHILLRNMFRKFQTRTGILFATRNPLLAFLVPKRDLSNRCLDQFGHRLLSCPAWDTGLDTTLAQTRSAHFIGLPFRL